MASAMVGGEVGESCQPVLGFANSEANQVGIVWYWSLTGSLGLPMREWLAAWSYNLKTIACRGPLHCRRKKKMKKRTPT